MADPLDRQWTHHEMPDGKPSRAAYNLGCPDDECKAANTAYIAAWRKKRQHALTQPDASGTYHTHQGQPSRRTAKRWHCRHARCLSLAGWTIDAEGVIRDEKGEIVPERQTRKSPA
jgi:hypothetical protein